MQLAVEGQGALTDDGVTLNGFGSIATEDASLAIPLFGLDAPPSATGVPLTVSANIAKDGDEIELEQVKARIGGDAVEGNARFERDGAKTTFKIAANADRVSLPAVLGILVAWERSSETEEMLGTISADTAEVWPARGFALDIIDQAQGDVTLNAKTLMLGTPFEVKGATLNARVDDDGIAVTGLDGQLFDGAFAASGTLSPRGNGAALTAQAKLQGASLEELSQGVAGKKLAEGPFDLGFGVEGEGLSPPGIVAGLSGDGSLSLRAGKLLRGQATGAAEFGVGGD